MPINRNQLYALCARAKVDLQTAQKWFDPSYRPRMKPSVEARISEAATELGIPIPQHSQKGAAAQ